MHRKIKFDGQGPQNPAHAWIQRLQFSRSDEYSSEYYEGKKSHPFRYCKQSTGDAPSCRKMKLLILSQKYQSLL